MSYKIITCVTTYNRVGYLKNIINTWRKTIDKSYDHTLIIADDGSIDGSINYLKTLNFEENIEVILNNRVGVAKQTNSLLNSALKHDFDYGFKADDDIWFKKPGWDKLYIDAINSSGFEHLCYHNPKWLSPRRRAVSKGMVCAKTSAIECMGCFWTFTRNSLDAVGKFDEKNF